MNSQLSLIGQDLKLGVKTYSRCMNMVFLLQVLAQREYPDTQLKLYCMQQFSKMCPSLATDLLVLPHAFHDRSYQL